MQRVAGAVVHRVAVAVAVARRRHDVGELVALAVVDELVVGHAALVHGGALLHEAGLSTLLLGGLLGDPRLLLGHLGTLLAITSGAAVLVGDRLAALVELTLRLLALCRSAHLRQQHEQGKQDDRRHDDHHDQSGGHGCSLPFGVGF
jgi:hypothetical protein